MELVAPRNGAKNKACPFAWQALALPIGPPIEGLQRIDMQFQQAPCSGERCLAWGIVDETEDKKEEMGCRIVFGAIAALSIALRLETDEE